MPPGLSDTSARVSPIMATTPAAISITPAIMRRSHLAVRVDQRIAKVKCGRQPCTSTPPCEAGASEKPT